MRKLLLVLTLVGLAEMATGQAPGPDVHSGRFMAANYGQWVTTIRSGTYCVDQVNVTLADGSKLNPWSTTNGTTLLVGSPGNQETVTPTAFNFISTPGQVCISATFTKTHFVGEPVSSGTFGLQEALNAAGIRGGGAVTLDQNWTALGGTTAIKNAATLPTNVLIEDARTGISGGGGGVTSVGLTVNGAASSGIQTVTGSPVTTSGTLNINLAGTSGGIPYFSSGTVLSSSAALAASGVVIGGGAATAPLTTGLTWANATNTLTLGAAGNGNAVLGLPGNTSGTATLTAPAVAGTSTNPVVSSNVLQLPAGAAATPALGLGGAVDGLYQFGTHQVGITSNGFVAGNFNSSAGFVLNSADFLNWCVGGTALSCAGIALNQVSASPALFGVGGSVSSTTSGGVAASSYQSRGTTFAASGCGNTTLVGGGSAGKYTSVTAGSCTVTITMGDSQTAPTGWVCDAHDLTTVADANNITMGTSTTTTANLVEGTVVANDVIAFKCTGY